MSIKKAIIILIIIGTIGSLGLFIAFRGGDNIIYTTTEIKTGNIIQTVSETGTIKASQEINLSFLNTGRLAKIYFKIGDQVEPGVLLAELDYGELNISRNEAKANLDVTRENLKKLLAGATSQDIAIAKANTAQAKATYDAAKNEQVKTEATSAENLAQARKTLSDLELNTIGNITTYEQAINSAQINLNNTKSTYQSTIDNYIDSGLATVVNKLATARTALDVIDRTINDDDGEDLISQAKPIYLSNTNLSYTQALALISQTDMKLTSAQSSGTGEDALLALTELLAALNKVFYSLESCFSALENAVTSADFTQSELDALKVNITAQQTAIATAITVTQTSQQNLSNAILSYNTNVSTAQEALRSAQISYDNALLTARNSLATVELTAEKNIVLAQSKVETTLKTWQVSEAQLAKTLAQADKYDVALSQARIRQAESALAAIDKRIENSQIRASLKGTITKIEYEIGEQVVSGQPIIALLGNNNFEIEVLVSEADIAKVKIHDKVEVTLDAFGEDQKFFGQTAFIEPAETEIQDVIYYKVTIIFDPKSASVKSGMTANIIIITASKENVVIVPNRAIVSKNGDGKFIRILQKGIVDERKITIGLRGDDGLTEVISGALVGEMAITHIKEE